MRLAGKVVVAGLKLVAVYGETLEGKAHMCYAFMLCCIIDSTLCLPNSAHDTWDIV